MRQLRDAIFRDRVPASASLALTDRCPLACRFCYVPAGRRQECDRAFWEQVIDDALAAGCLHVLLTGGDPMVRDDFAGIYTRARQGGALVTVFCSGMTLPDEALATFRDLPPTAIEVSLYGACAAAYETVCGRGDAFDRVTANIERMLDAGLLVRLKTLLTRETIGELAAMQAMARQWGVPFRFDGCLFPALDGNPRPLDSRLPPRTVVDAEFDDDRVAAEWRRFAQAFGTPAADDRLYDCGAGRTTFHVDADGVMRPCLAVRTPACDLKTVDFSSAWSSIVEQIASLKLPEASPCRVCRDRVFCGYCPGQFELETGRFDRPSDYLCRIGKLRRSRAGTGCRFPEQAPDMLPVTDLSLGFHPDWMLPLVGVPQTLGYPHPHGDAEGWPRGLDHPY